MDTDTLTDHQAIQHLESCIPPPVGGPSKMVAPAYEWMKQFDLLTDWHINSIIVSILGRSKYAKNVEMEVNVKDKYIQCTVLVGLWTLYLGSRQERLLKVVKEVFQVYAPNFNVDTKFIYGRTS